MLDLQGLAITFASDENDTKILNEVQNRFDVNITELPDEIDLSSYSKHLNKINSIGLNSKVRNFIYNFFF